MSVPKAAEGSETGRYEALAGYVERLRQAVDEVVERWEAGDLAGAVNALEQLANEATEADETAPFGRCGHCGAAITADEARALREDRDFVEHRDHLIRRRVRRCSGVTESAGGRAGPSGGLGEQVGGGVAEPTRCQHCGARITFVDGFWRDDTADPGDGYGGDATCGPLVTATGDAAPHVPA